MFADPVCAHLAVMVEAGRSCKGGLRRTGLETHHLLSRGALSPCERQGQLLTFVARIGGMQHDTMVGHRLVERYVKRWGLRERW